MASKTEETKEAGTSFNIYDAKNLFDILDEDQFEKDAIDAKEKIRKIFNDWKT